jgi:hypothetical protein
MVQGRVTLDNFCKGLYEECRENEANRMIENMGPFSDRQMAVEQAKKMLDDHGGEDEFLIDCRGYYGETPRNSLPGKNYFTVDLYGDESITIKGPGKIPTSSADKIKFLIRQLLKGKDDPCDPMRVSDDVDDEFGLYELEQRIRENLRDSAELRETSIDQISWMDSIAGKWPVVVLGATGIYPLVKGFVRGGTATSASSGLAGTGVLAKLPILTVVVSSLTVLEGFEDARILRDNCIRGHTSDGGLFSDERCHFILGGI